MVVVGLRHIVGGLLDGRLGQVSVPVATPVEPQPAPQSYVEETPVEPEISPEPEESMEPEPEISPDLEENPEPEIYNAFAKVCSFPSNVNAVWLL